ncbi:alpha-amylase family protein [Chitinimonas sp. BJYL2]|uniref:alpha-amylase n=1 Tax=Chitinimonas sp. BJYL2 TaxID=2976696 RepID=UPI0022B2FC85|nr:alpha-amylase family protein [Chitinimonas sp. BJYL2]
MQVKTRWASIALLSLLFACGGGGGSGSAGGSGTTPPQTPPPNPTPPTRPVLDPTYRASGHAAAGDVMVHLFEWKWADIATECETVLGPRGYQAVQISPPQEHIAGSAWWTRYQPVSHSLDKSRSGTRAEFVDMVGRCKAAGVAIYADAVINHMTAGSGTGTAGTAYTKYNYPGLFAQADFHATCGVNNYQSVANVQDCELVGLADLDTGSASVQQKLADYLLALARLGVAGFRIDAAKHIQPVELNAILAKVNQTLAAEGKPLPYYFAEVIDYGGEAVQKSDYFGLAYGSGGASDITEFKFRGVSDKFLQKGSQKLAELNPAGPAGAQFSAAAWGLMPADKAVVFLENHDTARDTGNPGLGYRDGAIWRLANVWMLAQSYGYPSILSGYGFDRSSLAGRDAGPPAGALACAASVEAATTGQWVCEHRDRAVANMVGFRRAVAGTSMTNWWDNGANAIAFSRGTKGFVAINREASALSRAFQTGLPAGKYCDVLTGLMASGVCTGQAVTVAADGMASLSLPSNSALALHVGQQAAP